MFLALWNYLNGYVMIVVSGFSVERFVNLCAHKNIYIWDVCRSKADVTMKVSLKGFWGLKECARKTGCRFRILARRGLPFLLQRYGKRKALSFGVILFVASLYLLSSFVWKIEIEGNGRIKEDAILNTCYSLGLKPGSWKHRVNPEAVTDALLTTFPDISWVSVKIKGTDAFIKIAEAIEAPKLQTGAPVCDIVAKKDGVIVSCATAAGRPIVKIGDVVKKGDILVSGEVYLKDVEEIKGSQLVAASADVRAKIWYQFTESAPLHYIEKKFTGAQKTGKSITILNHTFALQRPVLSDGQWQTSTTKVTQLSIGDYKIPISIQEEGFQQFVEEERARTPEEAQAYLHAKMEEHTLDFPKDAQVLSSAITFEQNGNTITANAVFTVVERIDEAQELTKGSDEEVGAQEPGSGS